MKTAIVHDWLVSLGGAEKVLIALLELYPSPLYTLLNKCEICDTADVTTSFLQKFPGAKHIYRNLLPFFPKAIESFDLESYNLILSSSHAVAKGVITHPHQLHICYCHTPMRYVWDLHQHYLEEMHPIKRLFAKPLLQQIKTWDLESLNRVHHFIANSNYVAERIKKNYNREATVIYPPVETDLFEVNPRKEDFYITVGRLVSYKKIDLIVEAFGYLADQRLVVIGDGPEMKKIQSKAGKNVELLGRQPDAVMRELIGRAKGFIFAGDEDFGIAVVEAQAAGTPIIAYGHGGLLETVSKETGVFFEEQTIQSLCKALMSFEKQSFDPSTIRRHAERFSRQRFDREYTAFVNEQWNAFNSKS